MRVALIIMADILALVAALLAVNEYHALKRRESFTVPFTDKLIAWGALAADKRERILREEQIVHLVGIALSVAVWLMLSAFFAGVSGFIAFPVGVAALLALLRPELGETDETRGQYYRSHKTISTPGSTAITWIRWAAGWNEKGRYII